MTPPEDSSEHPSEEANSSPAGEAVREPGGRPPQRFSRRWLRPLRLALGSAAVVAVLGLALALTRLNLGASSPEGSPPRPKGGATLHVFREADGTTREMISGERCKPGDRLQFKVDLPAESRIQIVGIEAMGRLYPVWPPEDAAVKLPAGVAQPIPGAVELDQSLGMETLYLVVCPVQGAAPACTSRSAEAPPMCRPGCATKPFVLTKHL